MAGNPNQQAKQAALYGEAFETFERTLNGAGGSARIRAVRGEAFGRFRELGFPTTRHEDWKYTDVSPIAGGGFLPAAGPAVPDVLPADAAPFEIEGMEGPRLVFVDGHYAPGLSRTVSLPGGIVAGSLAEALEAGSELVDAHLARHAGWDGDAFTALSTAFIRDGACVLVPDGEEMETPVHLLFLASGGGGGVMAGPRNLIVLGRGARARVVETYAGLGGGAGFTNAVTEAVLGEEASLDHYKVGEEADGAFHVGTLEVRQDRGSRLRSWSVTLGGRLVRNNIRTVLEAEGVEATLNGVYLGRGEQLVDNHTTVDHAMPRCSSWEFYKGILGGRATGVFNGRILVRQDAQKTDAKQSNRGLLLTRDATLNSKPQLEIFADDVKCTHGATVGLLEEDALFYLRTRGFGEQEARNALTFAFANEVIAGVEIEPLRRYLEGALMGRLQATG